ncbi:MAG TPA: hypothetical protein VFG59_17415, partial [Anaeromyxobacter sp.]|nr:hypothetical protein [Anaeromyxobacter sp.]
MKPEGVLAVLSLLGAALLAGTGCGSSSTCASETPGIGAVPACGNMVPTGTVTVHLDICPTC